MLLLNQKNETSLGQNHKSFVAFRYSIFSLYCSGNQHTITLSYTNYSICYSFSFTSILFILSHKCEKKGLGSGV